MSALAQRLYLNNWQFWTGAAMVALLVLAALFPTALSQGEPVRGQTRVSPAGEVLTGPFAPGTYGYVLGSDRYGRDLFAQLLYGARYTLAYCLVTATTRVALGALFGLWAGWFGGWAELVMGALSAALAAAPALIVAWGPLRLANQLLGFEQSAVAWVLILAALGWGETLLVVRAWTHALRPRAFVEAARALGRSEVGIVRLHIWPHVRGLLLMQVAFEMSTILLVVAELGYFQLFFGGGVQDEQTSRVVNLLPEWGAMLSDSTGALFTYPWLLVVPAAGFTTAIVGFNLLAEGIRRWLDRRLE